MNSYKFFKMVVDNIEHLLPEKERNALKEGVLKKSRKRKTKKV